MTQLALALKVLASPIDRPLLEQVAKELERSGTPEGRQILSRLIQVDEVDAIDAAYRSLDLARAAVPLDTDRVARAVAVVRELQSAEVQRMRAAAGADDTLLDADSDPDSR
jgi:hypothetical protein